jgi:hypothetical protein
MAPEGVKIKLQALLVSVLDYMSGKLHAPSDLPPLTQLPVTILLEVKVKGKSCCPCALTEHNIKAYYGVEVSLHAFLTSALDGGEWSASRPGRFTPRDRAPGIHWIGGWVGPRAVLDTGGEEKNSQPLPGIEPPPFQSG